VQINPISLGFYKEEETILHSREIKTGLTHALSSGSGGHVSKK
jgi:hypothetical protein